MLFAVAVSAVIAVVFWPRQVSSHETLTTTVLFDREIVRILNKHCVMCHVENGPSFPLSTYEDTWIRGRKIKAEVIARHMPPWAAVPGYGQFINDNLPTLRETQFLISWVEGLGPRNAGTVFLNVIDSGLARPKEVRAEADFGRWRLGTPSLMRQLPGTTIEPQQRLVTRTVVDLGLTSEARVNGLEYMPGDRRVVRAAFFTLQATGQWLGSWTPWYGFVSLPSGAAYRLPAGSRVVAEIHYSGVKESTVERGTLGLFFADVPPSAGLGESRGRVTSGVGPPPNQPSDLVLEAKGDLPSGVTAKVFRAQTRLAADTYALSLWPDLPSGATSMEVSARKPDGGTEILLFAKDFQMDWPTPYIFREPRFLPRGSVVSATAYYTNATATPQPGGFRLTVSRYEKHTGPGSAVPATARTAPPRRSP